MVELLLPITCVNFYVSATFPLGIKAESDFYTILIYDLWPFTLNFRSLRDNFPPWGNLIPTKCDTIGSNIWQQYSKQNVHLTCSHVMFWPRFLWLTYSGKTCHSSYTCEVTYPCNISSWNYNHLCFRTGGDTIFHQVWRKWALPSTGSHRNTIM